MDDLSHRLNRISIQQDPETDPTQGPERPKKPSLIRRFWWIILIPLLLTVLSAVAAYTGYEKGLEDRAIAEASAEEQSISEQLELGVEDLMEERYDVAKQRAEYVLSVDPNNEAAIGLLDLAIQALNQPTLTPTPKITPTQITPSPTPDLSSIESHFAAAKDAVVQENWDAAIQLLIDFRVEYPEYQPEEVDQLLFTSLRNRGLQNILTKKLEQGIYDLALAERFGPLDSQAISWRSTAAYYLFANSYVGLDWSEAYRWFSDLCAAAVWDSCYKYAISGKGYGDNLIEEEDFCAASIAYVQSIVTWHDPDLEPTATEAAILCMTATAPPPTPTPTIEGTVTGTVTPMTPTPTETGGAPVDTPTPTATETLAPPIDTDTPTPSPTITPE
ncbi:MAG: hypothetical protein GTO18_02475 [Anaerolineales bacterium]|nr:hypothetical protein [Anaerolineales bacterium]